jgi:hypothetical protein
MLAEYNLLFLSEKFFILRKIKRDVIRKVHSYSCKAPVILVKILIKVELPRKIFEKYPYIEFHENLPFGSRVFPRRGTDRQK